MDKLFLKNVHFLKLFSVGIIFDNITLNFKEMLNPQKSIIQTAGQLKDYISGCGTFSLNSQSVSLLQAYLQLEIFCNTLLAETGSKCPLVFSVAYVGQLE